MNYYNYIFKSMNQLQAINQKAPVPETSTFHTFFLKSLPTSGTHYVQIYADFSPRKNSDYSSVSTIPSFNSDGKHFTPAFCLSSDMSSEQQSDQSFFRNFENKKKQYSSQNKYLLQPKPESKYCQICHQYFQDYLKHTQHPVHIKKLREGSMESQINSLIHYFKNMETKSFKRNFTVDNNNEKTQEENSDFFQQGFKTHKKIKLDTVDNQSSEIYSNIGSEKLLVIGQEDDQISQF